ncbi:MAG: type I DNA topoisomerase [Xylanivirga thermophila]|jgi:DNA topoisomerase-1|uniref:type I DNA topoisomerase n=1 Tax=Xylanivirga thermophila TaxID=2496273 RepID=UPI00101CA1AE|nr:type I DNA topoisomerase [Xylanivirga thermophila]
MAQKLIIVESPAKANTIKKFLGRGYKVEATMGHIKDLPKSQLGVDIENNFEPKYITIRGKGEVINKLKKEAKNADKIFLATDPDREGEAISWHLANTLNIDKGSLCRIEFNEITSQAVKKAVNNPRTINMNLVDAQQARRILDRIVGYNISPLLWRKVKKGLSAGRVQSVATRIVCEREEEINNFIPQEYWNISANFLSPSSNQIFEAMFYGTQTKKLELKNEEEVNGLLEDLKKAVYTVKNIKKGTKRRNAAPPFTTSTLQQEAYRKLGFTTKKTMMIAQQLYEGIEIEGEGAVGLITYMRTDSTRISSEAQSQARTYIKNNYGDQYVPETPNKYKTKGKTQDAHEGVRPTSIDREPERVKDSLSRDQYRLYKLIYNRFLASQMTAAIYETMTINIKGGDYIFKAKGSRKMFPGYTVIYQEGNDDGREEKDTDINLPKLSENEVLELKTLNPSQHFTQAPPRYTEASLVKTLEELGIGRPSTYAPTISTIITRGYVVREGRNLVPTELGTLVNDLMIEFFNNIVDYKFTADMEEKLDKIEEGNEIWQNILADFYRPFKESLDHADKNIKKVEIADEESDEICEKCGARMVIKTGRYGKFLACPNFPDCRNTKPFVEKLDISCPKCNGQVVVRRTKKGRRFYGCENYPECDFVSWNMPSNKKCPICDSFMIVKKDRNGKENYLCSNKDCRYKMEEGQ